MDQIIQQFWAKSDVIDNSPSLMVTLLIMQGIIVNLLLVESWLNRVDALAEHGIDICSVLRRRLLRDYPGISLILLRLIVRRFLESSFMG